MKNKGCINPECRACEVRTLFDEDAVYCSQCGEKLHYVCQKCHTVLPDGSNKLCRLCEADKKVHIAKMQKNVGKGGAAIAGAAAFVANNKNVIVPVAKKALPYVKQVGKAIVKIIK